MEYVSHTCKNCKCAFIDIDKVNAFVSAPDYKYCTDCVKKGFKNIKQVRDEYKKIARFEEYIYNWQEKSNMLKEDVDFVFNKCMQMIKEYEEFGKQINTRSIFNQSIEILSYIKAEQNTQKICS